jgi:hypothetical protein
MRDYTHLHSQLGIVVCFEVSDWKIVYLPISESYW